MHRPVVRVGITAIVICAAVMTVGAVVNGSTTGDVSGEPPLADAGLDQTVVEGSTVHLDGSGSRAPGGEIERYEWIVTDSDGEETLRTNSGEPTATFEAESLDGYEATLVVTDDAGRSSFDTLYVDVEEPHPLSVSISSSRPFEPGETVDLTAHTDPGDAAVTTLTWTVGGEKTTITDPGRVETRTVTVTAVAADSVHVTVTDADGNTATAAAAPRNDGPDGNGETVPALATLGPDETVVDSRHRRLTDVTVRHLVIDRRTVSTTVRSPAERSRAFRMGYVLVETHVDPVFVIERRDRSADSNGDGSGSSDADGWTAVHETTDVREANLARQHDDLRAVYDTGNHERRWTMERVAELDMTYVDELDESHDHLRTVVFVDAELVGAVEGSDESVDLGVHSFEFTFDDHRSGSSLRDAVKARIDRRDCVVVDAGVSCGSDST